MKNLIVIKFALSFILISGCFNNHKLETEIKDIVVIYGNKENDSLLLQITRKGEALNYIYKLKNDTLAFSFRKDIKNDSSIYIYRTDCPLIASKPIVVSGQEYVIFKYRYDLDEVYDEESNVFYCENYGILLEYNHVFGTIYAIEYDENSAALIDSILKDSSGFYELPIPPPPIMNDSTYKSL